MVYILGNIGTYDMVLRPAYVLGPLSPILCSFILDGKLWENTIVNKNIQKIVRPVLCFCALAFGIYLNYKFTEQNISIFVL